MGIVPQIVQGLDWIQLSSLLDAIANRIQIASLTCAIHQIMYVYLNALLLPCNQTSLIIALVSPMLGALQDIVVILAIVHLHVPLKVTDILLMDVTVELIMVLAIQEVVWVDIVDQIALLEAKESPSVVPAP